MPITEMPLNQAPPEPPRKSRRNRYDDLEADDLLHVIDELEDRHSLARIREMIWISIIVHLLILWYIIYGPKYIYHVRVVDPSVVLRQRQKQLTYLNLPPDALKPVKPKQTNVISDKNRVAESQHPTLDKKTLEELEAMRRAGPQRPTQQQQAHQTPAPPQPQQQPSPAQQQAQAAPPAQPQAQPTPPAQPLPNNSQARLEAPKAAPTTPNFRTGALSPNEQLQQALRQAARGGYSGGGGEEAGGDDGMNAPSQHQGMQGAVDILSDTMGVDFSHYLQQVVNATKHAWYPIIPEEARPPLNKQGRVIIRFKIYPDGSVRNMVLEGPSGDVPLDRAAWGGITGAAPYPSLPKQFKGPYLELRFYFLYNMQPGQ